MFDASSAAQRHRWLEPGAFRVSSGVYRIPLPLPDDGLRAVNVYAITDGDGLVLVDSGWAMQQARDRLESALAELGWGFADVRRFLVTHVHRDHYTLGVTLRRQFGSRLGLGRAEAQSLEAITGGRTGGHLAHLRQWGAGHLAEQLRREREKNPPPQEDYEMPDEWFTEAQRVELSDRTLRVIHTPGHTRGHVVFVDEDASLMFAGDHVLPHITPSIGFEPARSNLPLGDYLDSLRLMRSYPDMRLLPAHGPVTDSVHTRVDELLAHHEQRLAETGRTVHDGAATAYEAALRLGWTRRERHLDELDLFNRVLAIGETAAHLDVLVDRGVLKSEIAEETAEYTPVSNGGAS